jgi:hypothetical protein
MSRIARIMVTTSVAIVILSQPALGYKHYHVQQSSKRCSNEKPKWCVLHVIYSKNIHGEEAEWLLRIPGCESSWKPEEVDASGSTGLYQFMPETWASTPYSNHSILSARWQSWAASWLYEKDEGGREWVCK